MNNTIITIIISSITGIVTFFFGVQKTRKEVEGLSITNIERSIGVYQLLIDDLRGQVEELLMKVNSLEDKINELERQNRELKKMLQDKS